MKNSIRPEKVLKFDFIMVSQDSYFAADTWGKDLLFQKRDRENFKDYWKTKLDNNSCQVLSFSFQRSKPMKVHNS